MQFELQHRNSEHVKQLADSRFRRRAARVEPSSVFVFNSHPDYRSKSRSKKHVLGRLYGNEIPRTDRKGGHQIETPKRHQLQTEFPRSASHYLPTESDLPAVHRRLSLSESLQIAQEAAQWDGRAGREVSDFKATRNRHSATNTEAKSIEVSNVFVCMYQNKRCPDWRLIVVSNFLKVEV